MREDKVREIQAEAERGSFFRKSLVILSAFILFFISYSELSAQPSYQGYLNLSFWTRNVVYSYTNPFYSNNYENILHLDFFQKILNYGNIVGLFDGAVDERNFKASHWFLEWQNISLKKGRLSLKLGDNNFQFSNLGYRFSNYFPSYNFIRGGYLAYEQQKFGLTFFTGRVARLSGLFGSIYDLTSQTASGFLGRVSPSSKVFLGFGYLHSENERGWSGEPLTKINDLVLLESEIKLSPSLKILGEAQVSSAVPADVEQRTTGSSLRFGPLLDLGRFTFELNYRRVSGDFRSLNSEYFFGRDQEGLYTSWHYQTRKGFYLFGAADYFHDNVDGRPELNTTDFYRINSGFSVFWPRWPDLTFRLDFSAARSRSGNHRNQVSPGFYLQLSKRLDRFFPYLRIHYQKLNDLIQNRNDFSYPSFYLGLSYNFRSSSYILLEAENTRRYDYLQNRTMTLNRYRLVSYSPFLWLMDFYGELAYSNYKFEYPYYNTSRRIEALLGLSRQLPWKMKIRVDLRASWPVDSDLPANYWLTFKMDKRFDWGQAPSFQGRAAGPEISGFGRIEGSIFSDENLNGVYDRGEKLLPGVEIRLEDGSQAVSDENGKFVFPRVVEGLHTLEVDLRRIPAEYYLLTPEKQTVVVAKRRVYQFNMALVEGANVKGRVFLDVNKNGFYDEEDQLLKDVLVILKPVHSENSPRLAGQLQAEEINTYTDENGQFRFENILPGSYELSVEEETLPTRAKLLTDLPIKLDLKPGKEVKDLSIILQPKPIIFTGRGR